MLKHIRRYRPDWEVDIVVGRGKHTALFGLCRGVYHDQEPRPSGPYDSVKGCGMFENYCGMIDRPGTKITNCLRDEFGINQWDADLGRYTCARGGVAAEKARGYLKSIGCVQNRGGKFNAVLLHFRGNTSPDKKNLFQWQAEAVVRLALRLGRVPVVLDWDNRNTIVDQKSVFCPVPGPNDIWGGFGSGDAEVLACLIQASEAFVGIDSGPGKVASSTDTPSLVCWRGHHPIQFHDPAPNTVHLIPHSHRRLPPVCDEPRMAVFFEKNYLSRTYEGDHGLADQAVRWLAETLGEKELSEQDLSPVTYCLPNGIGDVCWALTKIRSVAKGQPIDITLAGDPGREADHRSVPFLKRFPFVRSVRVQDVPMLEDRDNPADARGRYRYLPDGPRGSYHYLVPNKVLEQGRRLEDWLPEFPTDYDVVKEFDWSNTERGAQLGNGLAPFAAFYLGPESGHCDEGHNRGWLWEPRQWVELGRALREEHGLTIAVVGAPYDRSFWEKYVRPGVEQAGMVWVDLIGKLEIGETFALLKESKCLVSYQCGLAVVLHYMGGRAVCWWRPDGDSAHPSRMISFDNNMRYAWIRPGWEQNWIGCLYRKETVGDILTEMENRGWLE